MKEVSFQNSSLRHPEILPPAGIRTEPELLSPRTAWKREDELFRNTGHRGNATPKTMVSGDAPDDLQLGNVPKSPRNGLYFRESPRLTSRAISSQAVGRGVFTGSAVEPPPCSPGPHRRHNTIAHVDRTNPAYRSLDHFTVESAHARALAEHGPSAFNLSSGFGAEYLNTGVPMRSVTSLWSNHLRLSNLDDTLAKMKLSGAWGEGEQQLLGDWRPNFSRSGSGTFHFTPLPAPMVPLGTPRKVYSAGETSKSPRLGSKGGRHSKPISTNFAEDSSARGVLNWVPEGIAKSGEKMMPGSSSSSSSVSNEAISEDHMPPPAQIRLVADLPPPLPLLQPTSSAHTFVSRASKSAVTPRGRISALDRVQTQLMGEKMVEGLGAPLLGGGSTLPGSPKAGGHGGAFAYLPVPTTPLLTPRGSSGRLQSPPQTPGDAVRVLQNSVLEHGGRSVFPASPGKPPNSKSGRRGRGESGSGWDASRTPRSFDSSTSSFDSSSSSSSSSRSLQEKHASQLHSSEILVGPASQRDAYGVLRGVTRTGMSGATASKNSNPGLVRMRSGEELLAMAALQARAMYRLHAQHDVDLTHGFIQEGTWNAMNFAGRTQSSNGYQVEPKPLKGSRGGEASPRSDGDVSVGGFHLGDPPSEAFRLDESEELQQKQLLQVPDITPLGMAMAEQTQREVVKPNSVFQQYEQDKGRMAGGVGGGGAAPSYPSPTSRGRGGKFVRVGACP